MLALVSFRLSLLSKQRATKLQARHFLSFNLIETGFLFSRISRKRPGPTSHGQGMNLMFHPDLVAMIQHSQAYLQCPALGEWEKYISSTLIAWPEDERAKDTQVLIPEEKGNNTCQE